MDEFCFAREGAEVAVGVAAGVGCADEVPVVLTVIGCCAVGMWPA